MSSRGELAKVKRMKASAFSSEISNIIAALRVLIKLNQIVYKIANIKTRVDGKTYSKRVVSVNVDGKTYEIGKNEVKAMTTTFLHYIPKLKKLYAEGTVKSKSNRLGSDNFSDPVVYNNKVVQFFLSNNLGNVTGTNTGDSVNDFLRNSIFGQNNIGSIGIINSLVRLYAYHNNLYSKATVNTTVPPAAYHMNKIGVDNNIRNTFNNELNNAQEGGKFNPQNTDIISLSRVIVTNNYSTDFVKDDDYKSALNRFLRNIKNYNVGLKESFKERAVDMKGPTYLQARLALKQEYQIAKRSLDYVALAGNDGAVLNTLINVKNLSQNLSMILYNVDSTDPNKAAREDYKKQKKANK